MAKAKTTVARTGKKAAAYLRKSTDQQEASLPGQRSAIQEYAIKHGFEIIAEYVDSGISGVDSSLDRREFARLVSDATEGRFSYVIAWDLSRITRSDPMETIYELRPLRKANVKLMLTDRDQPLDWDSFAGMLTISVEAESNNQYVKKLARGTTRGQVQLAKQGKWVAGRAPLGYVVGDDRKLQLGPKNEVEAVRDAYKAYAGGASLRVVQNALKARGFSMVVSSVKNMLSNPLYTGDFVWGRNTQAKFFSMRAGEISTTFETGKTDDADRVIVRSAHPAIVDRKLFEDLQMTFSERKRSSTPLENGGDYVLSGLLRCADCGYTMVGSRTPTNSGRDSLFYRCCGSQVKGVEFCHPHNTMQDEILEAIFDTLADRFGNQETASKLRIELEKQLRDKVADVDLDQLKANLAKENARLGKASRRLVEVDSDLINVVQDQIRDIKLEIAKLESEIKQASTSVDDSLQDFDTRLAKSMELFNQFKVIYKQADPILLRAFLQSAIESIEIQTERETAGSRFKYTFKGAKIIAKNGENLFCSW